MFDPKGRQVHRSQRRTSFASESGRNRNWHGWTHTKPTTIMRTDDLILEIQSLPVGKDVFAEIRRPFD